MAGGASGRRSAHPEEERLSKAAEHVDCAVRIQAGEYRTWMLASRPEWFISRARDGPPVLEGDMPGDRVVLDDLYVALIIRTVALHESRYAAFRWGQETSDGQATAPSTLVEFWVTGGHDGTSSLTVRESFSTSRE
jgi:hypothetical protein